jgi:SpoVK/Ycf46/Vps4 family AAA+-type ATPase
MGILSFNSPFKIAYRDDFIAEYVGQTAVKTRKLLDSCIGGVLFVDEVYSLGSGFNDKDPFSKEAIEVLTAFLSENKKNFCFIGAGYEDDINRCFFSKNKGLERRFQWIHKIEEYTVQEIVDIMLKMIEEMNWKIEVNKENLIDMIKKEKHLFKYAGGDLEILLSKSKMVHTKRVFSLDKDKMFILTKTDVEQGLKLMNENKLKQENIPTSYMYT